MSAQPLLSIIIPTFNRSRTLAQSLDELIVRAESTLEVIEVVLLDNASEDDTESVIETFIRRSPSNLVVNVRLRQKNIGVAKSMVEGITIASGLYWCIMGDDDVFTTAGFSLALEVLRRDPRPSAFIQTVWPSQNLESLGAIEDIDKATAEHFYFAGNTFGGIFQTEPGRGMVLESPHFRDVEQNVWCQLAFGFTSILHDKKREPYLSPIETGQQIGPRYLSTKARSLRSLEDLIQISTLTEKIHGEPNLVGFLRQGRSNREIRRKIYGIGFQTVRDRDPLSTVQAQKLIITNHIPVGIRLHLVLLLSNFPRLLELVLYIVAGLARGPKGISNFRNYIWTKREMAQQLRNLARENEVRIDNFF